MLKVLTFTQACAKFPDFKERNGNDYALNPEHCIFFYYEHADNVLHIKEIDAADHTGDCRYYTFTQGNDEAWTWHHAI